ncbi:MAG: hypothetical protein ACYDC6_12590 [Acidobacteriaceae bacterium]
MLTPASTVNQLIQQMLDYHFPAYPSVTGLQQPITARSLAGFFGALAWAWLLLVAFTGWGRLAGKLARVERLPASIACSLGIAVVIFIGGFLNLLQIVYPSVLFALVAVGLALYLWLRRERPEKYSWLDFWKSSSRWSRLLIIATLLILFLRVAATVRLGSFNISDDSSAYLAFPQKMLASHHFAADYFSDRRVISSLGGAYLLQSFVIAATSLTHIAMADRTLGFILLWAAIFDVGIVFCLSTFQIALMEFLTFLAPQETINLTFVILPISLLLAMIWLLVQAAEQENRSGMKSGFLAGCIGGCMICLKSTYLPIVGAYALIPFLFVFWKTRKIKAVQLPLMASIGALILLGAWMIAMKMTSGTYLFPVLGTGIDYSSYGLFHSISKFPTHRTILKVFLQGFALLVLLSILLLVRIPKNILMFSRGVLVASALAITAFNYKSGGDFIWRYNFPQFLTAILVFYAATAFAYRDQPLSRGVRLTSYIGMFPLAAMMFYYDAAGRNPRPFRQMFIEKKDYLVALRTSLTAGSLANPSIKDDYRRIEQTIPDRGAALEDVAYPFLFNYKHKEIFLMDWPGAASPRPGWPIGQNSHDLVAYLRKQSVRYVVYDYRYALWNDAGACVSLERPQLYSTELYVLFWMSVLTDHQLDQLRTAYDSIYDDGQIAVVDLTRPLPKTSPEAPLWTIDTNKDEMCPEVMARYLANPIAPEAQ